MTERYFGFDWSAVLPWSIEGVSVEYSNSDEVLSFFAERANELFGGLNQHFLNEPMTVAKRRFCAEMDALLFRRNGEVVGYFMGHPSDWSSYYGRSLSLLPALRHGRFGTEFTRRTVAEIAERTPVRRFELDTSIGNPAMAKIALGLGFVPTMTVTSERWGLMTRYTKFLEPDARLAFSRQFVNAPELGQEIRGERT